MRELISLVIPVRNEHENIGKCLARLEPAFRDLPHEILVVYDREDDTTLAAIEKMPAKPRTLRLVHNTLGPSPSLAIRAGITAAEGDVIAVTMADLSDPPEAIVAMAAKIRAGADVVSGSRYMRGGSQTGGPIVKTLLSRAAGLSLAWVAGIGTHDATTSFRGFSRRFVDSVPLESRTGFTFGIEATVKAHRAGFVVSEVPSSWVDRTAGESNFRVAKWLGAYLRWYFLAMWAPLVVWSAWIVQTALVVASSSSPVTKLAAPVTGFALVIAARRARGRMHPFDVGIPLCFSLPILVGRGATSLGWAAALCGAAVCVVAARLAKPQAGRRMTTAASASERDKTNAATRNGAPGR